MAPTDAWIFVRFVPTVAHSVADLTRVRNSKTTRERERKIVRFLLSRPDLTVILLQIGVAGAIVRFIGRVSTIVLAIAEARLVNTSSIRAT